MSSNEPKRTGRPADEAKREAILAAAAASFFEHGFAASSIEQIAADAGVSKVTIYNRFGDKRALFAAACIGNTFSVPLLAEVLGLGLEATVDSLSPAIELGLLISVDLGELKALSEVDSLIKALPAEEGARGGQRRVAGDSRIDVRATLLSEADAQSAALMLTVDR